MSISYNIFRVDVDLARLRANYRAIRARCANPIPVVKADAYGHGLIRTAAALSAEGASRMAVGTVGEAVDLRRSGYAGDILSLLGPQLADDFPACAAHNIIPFIYRPDQMRALNREAQGRQLPIVIKFNTGMSRLGFNPDDAATVLSLLADHPGLKTVMAASHFATSDVPDQEGYVREQAAAFARGVNGLRAAGLAFEACLANTGAIFAYPEYHFDAQRPGIALYGCNPFHGTPWADKCSGVAPAMSVSTRIVDLQDLSAGTTVSYGRTFTAERDMRIAIAACGYADNYSRGLSNKAEMLVRGHRAGICGRVCMQLTALDVTGIPDVAPGDEVFVLGGGPGGVTPEELAGWWGTITYEVFCLLGQNPRAYHGE